MLVSLLAQGDDVALIPLHRDLSLVETAALLALPEPTVESLVASRAIPTVENSTERRIRLSDLVAYKARRSAQNRAYLAEALAVAQEAGAYD